MELTCEVCEVLAPLEMRKLRKGFGITLRAFSVGTGISMAQISEFECGKNGLSLQQVKRCEQFLLATAREKSQLISKLLSHETEAEIMAAV